MTFRGGARTGKTHAFRYLETVVGDRGDISFYTDLRTVGSPEGLFVGDEVPATERAARLLVDLMAQLHDAILDAVLNNETLIADDQFVHKVDALATAVTTVRVAGDVQVSREGEESRSGRCEARAGARLSATGPVAEAQVGAEESQEP